jgi:uncharacterized protein YkwD
MDKVILIGMLLIGLHACGGGSSVEKTSSSVSSDLTVNAGSDKSVMVNKSITIEGSIETDQQEGLSYVWKENNKILATTKTFIYTPTMIGVSRLSFIVQESDGSTHTDYMLVIVTEEENNREIPVLSEALKNEYLDATNKARVVSQDCGTKGMFSATTPIVWNEKLYHASYAHMQDLILSKTFSHDGSGTESDWAGHARNIKSTQVERVESHGYSWERLGENLAGGNMIGDAGEAVQAWLESDNHCANLMNPLFEEMGMVMLTDEDTLYVNYWGQNFGTPK